MINFSLRRVKFFSLFACLMLFSKPAFAAPDLKQLCTEACTIATLSSFTLPLAVFAVACWNIMDKQRFCRVMALTVPIMAVLTLKNCTDVCSQIDDPIARFHSFGFSRQSFL